MADNIPNDLKYTKEHEWVRVTGNRVVVGVTDHAQKQRGDVVYVELPKVGDSFEAEAALGTIESVFNLVWRVRTGRVWYRKVTDYVSVVLLIPFLLLFAVGLTSALREQEILRSLLAVEVVHGVVLFALGLAPIAMNVVALDVKVRC